MSRATWTAALATPLVILAGCASNPGTAGAPSGLSADSDEITFHARVSSILQNNCQSCHREGGGTPFALVEYDDVYDRRGLIRAAVEAGRMPPWFADPAHGEWANDRTLSTEDRRDLLAWIDAGAPEGDPRNAPAPIEWPEGWTIGEPDYVATIPEPITVPAEGRLPYQNVEVETDFAEDRWVTGMQILPSDRSVVHHALVFMDAPDSRGRQSALDGFYAAYGPGAIGVTYPDGMARRLPAGATLRFQIHYETSGREVVDRTSIGFVFADEPPERVIETGAVAETDFVIPAGHPDYEVSAEHTFAEPTELLGFVPHMHIRGKAFRFELIRPDGEEEVLLDARYVFTTQVEYLLAEPLAVEAGSLLRATGWFDNSAENPGNPDPTADVPFGPQTDDEMMIGYFHYVADPPER